MSGIKFDILWVLYQVDRFVVCDLELSFYYVEFIVNLEFKVGFLCLFEDFVVILLLINLDIFYMKCVVWYFNYDFECLLVVG